jgi:hypothetical protein
MRVLNLLISVSLKDENVSNMNELEAEEGDDDLVPTNPIERRDAKIAELEKNVADMAILQENALKMKAKLNIAVKSSNLAKHRLKFAMQVTEE